MRSGLKETAPRLTVAHSLEKRSKRFIANISDAERFAVLTAPQNVSPEILSYAQDYFSEMRDSYAANQQFHEIRSNNLKTVKGIPSIRARIESMREEDQSRPLKQKLSRLDTVLADLKEGQLISSRDLLLGEIVDAILDRRLTFKVKNKRAFSNQALSDLRALRALTPGQELEEKFFDPLQESLERPIIGESSWKKVENQWDRLPTPVKAVLGVTAIVTPLIVRELVFHW